MGVFGGGGSVPVGSPGGISPSGPSGLSGVSGEVGFGDFARNMLLLHNGIMPTQWNAWKAQHQGMNGSQASTQNDPMRALKGMQPSQAPGQSQFGYGSPNVLGRLTSPY